jgi:uroporphyrin-III C-methyltransferase/precorrin-2 dehydrogenase/sirohydrochlorin ferrochelatase
MNSLATLPIFLRLRGVKAVLAGNGEPAAWKTELLAAAGAQLALLAPDPAPRLEEAASRAGVEIVRRAWTAADFEDATIALLEPEDDEEAVRFRAAARAAGALVNVIDRPKFCDFSFGSLVERSPLVIGISTDGAAPVFAQAIRAKIETLFPETLRDWAQAARAWRGRFSGLEQRRRRAIWLDFADRAFASVDRAPDEADFDGLSLGVRAGRLVVVGTGPGTPDDLTQRAVRALQAADHVIEDGPVNPALRDLGRREATFERWPEGANEAARAAAAARVAAGQIVVALLPGDGRGTAWAGAEVAPGVSP